MLLEDGFVDLALNLEALIRNDDGSHYFEARAEYKGKPVAFAVVLSPNWQQQDFEDSEISLYWGGARLISLGAVSDDFLDVVDQRYETKLAPVRMRGAVDFIAVCLEGNPEQLGEKAVKMKLLFDVEDEDRYAEFYLNCDPAQKRVQFHEKDSDYRRPVVLALGE